MLFSSKMELVMLFYQHGLAELSVSRPAVCTQVVFWRHSFCLHISLLNTLMTQRKNNIKLKKYDLLNYMISRKNQLSEGKREDQWEEKRQCRRQSQSQPTEAVTGFTCSNYNRLCRSRIGLFSHSRHCNSTTDCRA